MTDTAVESIKKKIGLIGRINTGIGINRIYPYLTFLKIENEINK